MRAEGSNGSIIWIKNNWATIYKKDIGFIDIKLSSITHMNFSYVVEDRRGYLQLHYADEQTTVLFDHNQEPYFGEIRDLIKRI